MPALKSIKPMKLLKLHSRGRSIFEASTIIQQLFVDEDDFVRFITYSVGDAMV